MELVGRPECFFRWPTKQEDAVVNNVPRNPYSARPFGCGQRVTVSGNQPGIAPIALLNHPCRPLTIARTIWSVIVATLKRVLRAWARPHISQEVFELQPTTADGNAPAGIVRMGSASVGHADPDPMLWRLVLAVLLPLRTFGKFRTQTSARPHKPVLQAPVVSRLNGAAVASIFPNAAPAIRLKPAGCRYPAEPLSRDVYESCHARDSSGMKE